MKLMTTDDFFAKVKEDGFNGYSPSPKDVMGDAWARKISNVFDSVADAQGVKKEDGRHIVWMLFQWLYCEMAGMRSRVVATPPAIRASGQEITPLHIDTACRLLLASQEY